MRLRTALLLAIVVLVVIGGGIYVAVTQFGEHLPTPLGRGCEVRTSSGTVKLNAVQMANAATIAAVGIRRDLPDRAIVVALAAALQESELESLTGGDRDSVGLFQQRPSQGWGTPEQIQDPRYSAGKFYSALVRVKDWEKLRVTEAAQRVQRSAYPNAYEKWSDESTVLAEALAGEATSAVTCTRIGEPTQRGPAAALALGTGLRLDWGEVSTVPSADVIGLIVPAADLRVGWQYAHWLVAHSSEKSVERVRFGDQEWSADRGTWRQIDSVSWVGERVVAEVYPS